jgi:CheY-like chemotaxis protein
MAQKSSRYKTLMLVDDNPIDNLINQKMIEASSFAENIYTFSGAVSALDFLKNLDRSNGISQDNIPDLIFLDINMPLLDGFQFLEEFEKLNGPNSAKIKEYTKVIMVSSSINPKDMDRAEKNKFVKKYVNKPLSIKTLDGLTL